MQVISVLLIILCVFSVRFEKSSDGYVKKNTDALKGLLALSIMLSHLTGCVDYQIPVFGFSSMGVMGVGAFFCLSGYALVVSSRSGKYFRGFLGKRYIKIGVPYLLMLTVYVVLIDLIGEGSTAAFAQSFINGYPVSNSWYVFGCAYCYFIFWLAFRREGVDRRRTGAFLVVAICSAAYIFVTAYVLSWGNWWYKTICCFLIGILWGAYDNKLRSILAKYYVPCLGCSFLLLVGAYLFPAINSRILHMEKIDVWLTNDIFMGICFALFVLVFLFKFHVRNRITDFLGAVSYEIYLYHGLIMDALKSIGGGIPMETHLQQELYAALVVALSICIAAVMHKLDILLVGKILGRGNLKCQKSV